MKDALIAVREIKPSDREWVQSFLEQHFGSTKVVSRNVLHRANDLPGFIAMYRSEPSALLTYCVMNGDLEVVSLHAAIAGRGLGSRLLASARERARDLQCRRLWLITTNDNEPAIAFYKRWGMHLAAVHRGAIAQSRKLKPEISLSASADVRLKMKLSSSCFFDSIHVRGGTRDEHWVSETRELA